MDGAVGGMNARYWTPDADALLVAGTYSDADLAVELGRTVTAIRLRRWKVQTGRATYGGRHGRTANRVEDVWKYVDKRGPNDCWPWTAARRRRGYGAFTVARKNLVAHRVAFQAATGIDPADKLVCHSCDNPPCCNPAHLFLGTATENVHDMLAKGRANPPRGENHHGAKLTEEEVREIRRRRAAGEKLIDLAKEFGVADSRLSVLVNHPERNWSHV